MLIIISHYILKKRRFMSLLICFKKETRIMKFKVAWGPKLSARRLPRPVLGGISTGNCNSKCDCTRQPSVLTKY